MPKICIPITGATLSDATVLVEQRGNTEISLHGGIDTYTKLLLHMEGTDGGTTFTDTIGTHTFTANGNAHTEVDAYKFGATSAYFDGTGDWIECADHADFAFGSGDFTIDFWMKSNAAGTPLILGQCDNTAANNSDLSFEFQRSGNTIIMYYFNNKTLASVTNPFDNNWHHIAVERYGNIMTMYVDGIAEGVVSMAGLSMSDSTKKFSIGRIGEYTSGNYTGYIDEFRISKGIARYKGNFTPLTLAYADCDGSPTAILPTADSGSVGTVWDMSTISDGENCASETGTVNYKYAYGDSNDPTNWNASWLSLANLRLEADVTARYFRLQAQFVSDGTQDASLQDLWITATTYGQHPRVGDRTGGIR